MARQPLPALSACARVAGHPITATVSVAHCLLGRVERVLQHYGHVVAACSRVGEGGAAVILEGEAGAEVLAAIT